MVYLSLVQNIQAIQYLVPEKICRSKTYKAHNIHKAHMAYDGNWFCYFLQMNYQFGRPKELISALPIA